MRVLMVVICALVVILQAKASVGASPYLEAKRAVCYYFGDYCSQAMRVASCETGGTYDPRATNGQYVNIFQMGYHERQTYGWHVAGSSVWLAARAAWRYFDATGRDWSPWSCGWAA